MSTKTKTPTTKQEARRRYFEQLAERLAAQGNERGAEAARRAAQACK